MLFEYRTYEYDISKKVELHDHFRNAVAPLLKKYGITAIGFWESTVGVANEIHYLLAWRDYADRETRWPLFLADTEWAASRARMDKDGSVVTRVTNSFWRGMDYSESQ